MVGTSSIDLRQPVLSLVADKSKSVLGATSLSFLDVDMERSYSLCDVRKSERKLSGETLHIAAGAKIDQEIQDDSNDLTHWQSEPEAVAVINYCSEEDADTILAAGKVDVIGSPEGFMKSTPVGN